MNRKNIGTLGEMSPGEKKVDANIQYARFRFERILYWKANLRILFPLLAIWFAVSYGAGVLFADFLNQWSLGGFPLGFWFAQQGSIGVFVVLIWTYVFLMNRLDREFGVEED